MTISKIVPFATNPANDITSIQNTTGTAGTIDKIGKSFGQVLNSLSESEQTANSLLQSMAAGENVDIHRVMIATEENDVNFKVAMAIRDRLVEAYREVTRMTI
ncbi:MAG TPA: flagellar hook-basal body complex protein FliE [Anaerolineaceae bacterium]